MSDWQTDQPHPKHNNPGQHPNNPTPQYYGNPQWEPQPPQKKSHWVRNTLLTSFCLLILGGAASCAALFLAAGSAVNDAVTEAAATDAEPGGPDNPLEIHIGKPFKVSGFAYQSGWKASPDAIGSVDVHKLRVTNHRKKKDSALVDIKFWKGTEVVAATNCTSDPIDVGTTVALSCLSGDDWVKGYDRITINDTF